MAKTRGPVYHPNDYCPICGTYWGNPETLANNVSSHRCSKKVLGGIDGANTRALDNEDKGQDTTFPIPAMAQRLKDGFKMLDNDEEF